jgi:hypothetical protein
MVSCASMLMKLVFPHKYFPLVTGTIASAHSNREDALPITLLRVTSKWLGDQ